MSVIGKKPFVVKVLDSCSKAQLNTFHSLLNSIDSESPISVSLDANSSVALSNSNKGVSFVSFQLNVLWNLIVKGILVYTDTECALFGQDDSFSNVVEYKINPSNLSFVQINENLTASELRQIVTDKLMEAGEGMVTDAELESTLSNYVTQTELSNAFVNSKDIVSKVRREYDSDHDLTVFAFPVGVMPIQFAGLEHVVYIDHTHLIDGNEDEIYEIDEFYYDDAGRLCMSLVGEIGTSALMNDGIIYVMADGGPIPFQDTYHIFYPSTGGGNESQLYQHVITKNNQFVFSIINTSSTPLTDFRPCMNAFSEAVRKPVFPVWANGSTGFKVLVVATGSETQTSTSFYVAEPDISNSTMTCVSKQFNSSGWSVVDTVTAL